MPSIRTLVPFYLLLVSSTSSAAVTEYTDEVEWQSAAGAHTTITFAELPLFTLITDQYAYLGVLFTDGSDYTHGFSFNTFPNDGYGLNGALDETSLEFSQPTYAIGADFPGGLAFKLYYQDQLIYSSNWFGGSGAGWFGGLVSDEPFDMVYIYDPFGGLFIDDLHFGPPIPAPGVLVTLILAQHVLRSRRRRAFP